MAAIDDFRKAASRGDHDVAASAAHTVMDAMGRETPTEIFVYLDRAAAKSQHAALICATSFFLRNLPDPDHQTRLFKKAARGPDDELASSAYYMLAAGYALDDETRRKSLDYLDRAADLGHVPAMLLAAEAYETGTFRNRRDLDRAWELLRDALDTEYPPAKVAGADFMLRNEVYDLEYDPMVLLAEAVQGGVDGAPEALLARTPDIARRIGKAIPSVVIPDGIGRITLLVEAICNELHISQEDAAELVAELYGHGSWESLVASAEDPDEERGPFDEDVESDALSERKLAQLAAIDESLEAPPLVIEAIWDLLRPTARKGVPSLRGLARRVSES